MGKISNAINHYLSDNRRFADPFNGICFQGETVVRAEDLSDTSQVYYGITGAAGKNPAVWQIFKDYPMQLYCLNEEQDLRMFHTEVGLLFRALQYRRDRVGLKKLMERDERYKYIDADTLETMTVMLDLPAIWKERVKYVEKNEEEEYDMCQAIREWAEEERSIGRQEGLDEKTGVIVRNMLRRGMADADIMAIAECDPEFIDGVRSEIKAAVIRL